MAFLTCWVRSTLINAVLEVDADASEYFELANQAPVPNTPASNTRTPTRMYIVLTDNLPRDERAPAPVNRAGSVPGSAGPTTSSAATGFWLPVLRFLRRGPDASAPAADSPAPESLTVEIGRAHV